jgi:hypothetical protein
MRHALAIYTLFAITFLSYIEPALSWIGGYKVADAVLPLLVFLSAFMAFQFLASHREPLIEPRKIKSADFGAELVGSIHPRRHALGVDFIAYTSETLEKALDALRDVVSSGQHRLKVLKVRVLVWDGVSSTVLPCTLDLDQPSAMNRRIECDYRERTHQKIAEHTNKVREIGEQIRRNCNMTAEQCNIEVRYSLFEPSFKAIVLNSTVVFLSISHQGSSPDLRRADKAKLGSRSARYGSRGTRQGLGHLRGSGGLVREGVE